MDTTSAVVTDPTIVPASTSTNDTTELTTTSNDINVNQSNSNSSAHIAGDTGKSNTTTATTASGSSNGSNVNNGSSNSNSISSNSNSSSSSSSTSSNSSGYGSTTTTPTNNTYETHQQQQQTPTPSRTPTTPIAIAEPIIPVATVAAVTPFYNEAITTHTLEIQHQQQQQQHHHQQQQQHQQHQQQHQLQQNIQHNQYLPRQQYYSPYDYQQQTSNLSSSSSTTTAYNMPATYDITSTNSLANAAAASPSSSSSQYVGGQYKSTNLSAINYERNLAGRPTAAATSYYHQQQVPNEQNSKSLQNLQSTAQQQQQQFAKQRSSTSLITSSTNINTSKPQAAATPFYAQPLPQHSNPATFYDNLKHKMPLEYHHHHYDSYTNPVTATYQQQQKYYAAAKSQLKEATSYGSPGLASKSLYPNPTNLYPGSTGNHSLTPAAYDKYMYPHATATGYPATSHLVNDNPPDTSYRKTAVANTLNSPSWPWGIEYASGNSRTIPPPTTHLPTATVAPTHATYLSPNPSAHARDPYYMAQDNYTMKYDKYSTPACPPSYQQSYVSPPATRHHMWPSSHGPQLNDRHLLATQPSAPIPQHALHSTPYYPTNSASVLTARQACCPQPYQPQSCYFPSPHPPNSRLAHNQPPPTVMAPTAAAYMSTQQPLNQTSHLNALSSSCKYSSGMTDYANGSGNKVKNPNDLYLTSHYDANNYGAYGSNHQLYQPNAHQLPNHGPSQGSILTHDSIAVNPASYTNDLNITSNFDNYPPQHQDSHITPNTFGAIHSQQSPQYAPTVVKRALLDYRKPIQPQPPPLSQEEINYTTLTPASKQHYQELLNTPETTTAFADYETNHDVTALTYNQTPEAVTETDKDSEEATKNLSLRDFIANWNDDEDEYTNAEDLNFDETTVINEVLQATPQVTERNEAELESIPLLENLKAVETKESNNLKEKLSEALNVNLPDIIIDIEKSNNVNNSITTPSASPTTNILNNFDVEQELDQLKKKKEDEKLEATKDFKDIKEYSPSSSVTTPQLSPCKGGVTTQLSFEDLNLEQSNKAVPITTRPDTNSTNEQYFKDIEGYDSGSSRHSNESAFEKEYETFINKITSDATSKIKSNSVKTAGETEIDFEQNVQDFSKFYKRKRKLKEDELNSSLLLTTQNKKKIKSATEEIVNNSNFPQVYTKKSRNRLSKHNVIARKHKPLSLYYKIIHSLRRYRLYRIKRVRDYIAELKEKHLPLIKRQSIKNYSHAVQENIFTPKSLKSLTILAINTTEFRQRIMLSVEESTENNAESEEKHICTDPSCETCEVIRSLMEPESFEELKPSTGTEETYEIPEECINNGIIFQDLSEYSIQYPKAEILLCQNSEILLCDNVHSENVQQCVDSENIGRLVQVLVPDTTEQLKTSIESEEIHSSLDCSSKQFSDIINDENIIEKVPFDVTEADQNNKEISDVNNQKEIDFEKIPEILDFASKNATNSVDKEIKSLNILSSPLRENFDNVVLNTNDNSIESAMIPIFETTSPKSKEESSEALQPEVEKDTYPILKISELLKKSLNKKLKSPMSATFKTTKAEANKGDSNELQPKIDNDSYPILKMSELLKKSQILEKKFSESFESDKNMIESDSNSETNLSDDEDSTFSDDSHSDISDNDELLKKSPNHKITNTEFQKDFKLTETSKECKINDQILANSRSNEKLKDEAIVYKESFELNADLQAPISNNNISSNNLDDNKKDFETNITAKENKKSEEVIENDSEDSNSSDSDSESSSNSDSDDESVDEESSKMSTDKESSSNSDSESESEEENISENNVKVTANENVVKSIAKKSLPPSIELDHCLESELKNFTESVEESENLKKLGNYLSLPSEVQNKAENENNVHDKSSPTLSVKENFKTLNLIKDLKNSCSKTSLESNKDSDSEWDDESEVENDDVLKSSQEKDFNSPKSVKESENVKLQLTSNENGVEHKEAPNDLKASIKDTKNEMHSSSEDNKNSDSDWNDESDVENTDNTVIIPEKPISNERGLKLILKLKDIKSYRSFKKEHLDNCKKNSITSESETEDTTETKIKEVGKGNSQTKLISTIENKSSKISDTETDSYSDFETETEDDDIYTECYNKTGHKSVQVLRASQTLLQHNLELLHNAENSNRSQSSHQMSLDFFKSAEDPDVSKTNSIVISDDESMDISENVETKNNASSEECSNILKSTEEPKETKEDAILISDDDLVDIPNKNIESVKDFAKVITSNISAEILEESKENCENIETIESHENSFSESLAKDKINQLAEEENSNEIAEKSEKSENLRKKSSIYSLDKNEEVSQELFGKYNSEKCSVISEYSNPPFATKDLKDHNTITSVDPQDRLSNESSKVNKEIREFSREEINQDISSSSDVESVEKIKRVYVPTEVITIPIIKESKQPNAFDEVLDLSLPTVAGKLEENKANEMSEDTCALEKPAKDDCQTIEVFAKLNAENLCVKSHSPEELISNREISENMEDNSKGKSYEIIFNSCNSSENEKLIMESSVTRNEITDKLENTIEELKQNSWATKLDNIVDHFQKSDEVYPNSPDSPKEVRTSSENEEIIAKTSEFTNKTAKKLDELKSDFYTSKFDKNFKESNEIIQDSPDSPEENTTENEKVMVTSETDDEIAEELEELKPDSFNSEFDEIAEEPQKVNKKIPDSPDSPENVVKTVRNLSTEDFINKEIELNRASPDSPEELQTIVANFKTENFPNKEVESDKIDDNSFDSSKDVFTNIEISESYETSSVGAYRCNEKEDSVKLKKLEDLIVREHPYESPLINECISELEESGDGQLRSPSPMSYNEIEVTDKIESTEEHNLKLFPTIGNKISEDMKKEDQLIEVKSKESKQNSAMLSTANNESEVDVLHLGTTVIENKFETSDAKDKISVAVKTEFQNNECNDKSINLSETYEKSELNETISESLVEASEINDYKIKSKNSENLEIPTSESSDEESELNDAMPETNVNKSPSELPVKDTETMDVISEPAVGESKLHKTITESSETIENRIDVSKLNETVLKPNLIGLEPMDFVSECVVNELKFKETILESTVTTVDSIDESKDNDNFSKPTIKDSKTMEITSEPVCNESKLLENISNITEETDRIPEIIVEKSEHKDVISESTIEESIDESKSNDNFSEATIIDSERIEISSEPILKESKLLENISNITEETESQILETIAEESEHKDVISESTIGESIDESKGNDTFTESTIIDSETIEISSEPILNESKLLENISNITEETENQISDIIVEESEHKDIFESTIKDSELAINKIILHKQISESTFKEPELSHIYTNSDIFKEITTKNTEAKEDQISECSDVESTLNETISKSELNDTISEPIIKELESYDAILECTDEQIKQHQSIPQPTEIIEDEISETMDEESKLNDTISEPTLKEWQENYVVTDSKVDGLELHEKTEILKDRIQEIVNENSRVVELEYQEIVAETTKIIDYKISETVDKDSDAITESAVKKPKTLETVSESTETIHNRNLENIEEYSKLNDDTFFKSKIQDSELNNVISETAVDELKLLKTVSESTETMDKEFTFNDTYPESAIYESNLNNNISESTVKDAKISDISLEPINQESLSNETVLASIIKDQFSKIESQEAELNASKIEDQISEAVDNSSELNEGISETTDEKTELLSSITAITLNISELDAPCSTQSTTKEPDVNETILESLDINTTSPNIEFNQTYSDETKSDILQHDSQPELLTGQENTTEDLSGDFFGFKNQSSFESESNDFHGFEDIEEATRIRREIENLNDDSAANDGFQLNTTLNKESQKSSTTSLTESTTSEINELEALEKEISQQHIEKELEQQADKETDTALVNETNKIISTNDIEHIKKMLESDEEPQQDECEYCLQRDDDKPITSGDETIPQTKDVIKTITDSKLPKHNDNDNFVDNFRDISKDILNSVIPKLSDLCRAALNSSLNTNNLTIVQNVQDQIDKTHNHDTPTIVLERELSVEEALAEMYRQAGVLLSDPEDNDTDTHRSPTNNCNEEAQDVLLINLQEILNSDNDVYVLQCDMNKNLLNVVQTNDENEDNSQDTNTERVNTVQFIGILDTEDSEPQIHIISSDSESEVILLSDDCESDFEPITDNRHERVIIPFINDFDINTDEDGNLSDISTIHHEEIVPENLDKFLQEEFYKYLHEKYVQRNISKYYHANRVLKKYKKRFVKK